MENEFLLILCMCHDLSRVHIVSKSACKSSVSHVEARQPAANEGYEAVVLWLPLLETQGTATLYSYFCTSVYTVHVLVTTCESTECVRHFYSGPKGKAKAVNP